jgi:Fic family protein
MSPFTKLHALREFEKRHLGFLRTLEDYDMVREIGLHEERGKPLTLKRLYTLDLASMATIQRRLRRLKALGVIVARKSGTDGRAVELTVSPKVLRIYARYCEMLAGGAAQTAEIS